MTLNVIVLSVTIIIIIIVIITTEVLIIDHDRSLESLITFNRWLNFS